MNSMKVVIPWHKLYWSIHTENESKRGTTFCFHLWCEWTLAFLYHSIAWNLSHEIECKGMTSFMEFIIYCSPGWAKCFLDRFEGFHWRQWWLQVDSGWSKRDLYKLEHRPRWTFEHTPEVYCHDFSTAIQWPMGWHKLCHWIERPLWE